MESFEVLMACAPLASLSFTLLGFSLISSSFLTVWMLIWTIPQWETRVLQPVDATNGSIPVRCKMFFTFFVLLHSLSLSSHSRRDSTSHAPAYDGESLLYGYLASISDREDVHDAVRGKELQWHLLPCHPQAPKESLASGFLDS